jgi:hypothetical protein
MIIAKRFAIGFGLAAALPLLINLGVTTFWKAPVFTDYYDSGPCCTIPTTGLQTKWDAQKAAYDRAETLYEDRLFTFAVPLGIAALIIGSMIAASSVGPGLMFGGLFSVIEGYGFCWDKLPESLRFGSLLVAFAILIYLGLRKIEPRLPLFGVPSNAG